MFGEGCPEAPDLTAALVAALPGLRDVVDLVEALQRLALNLLSQLGGLCAEHTRKATILQGSHLCYLPYPPRRSRHSISSSGPDQPLFAFLQPSLFLHKPLGLCDLLISLSAGAVRILHAMLSSTHSETQGTRRRLCSLRQLRPWAHCCVWSAWRSMPQL